MSTIYDYIFRPIKFKHSFQDKDYLTALYCPYCRGRTNKRTKRYKNTKSLYHHLCELEKTEPGIGFVFHLLTAISISKVIGLIK